MSKRKLVRVDYEIPPTRGIMSMYFEDDDVRGDNDYEDAVRYYYNTAIIRGVTRNYQKPEDATSPALKH